MTKRYFFPVHRMDAYRGFARARLPVTDQLYERLLCIPLYHDLEDEQIDAIAGFVRTSLERTAARHRAA
jgi:dTDP-4-amino-4,6-dideoxygalactose transaminase